MGKYDVEKIRIGFDGYDDPPEAGKPRDDLYAAVNEKDGLLPKEPFWLQINSEYGVGALVNVSFTRDELAGLIDSLLLILSDFNDSGLQTRLD